MARQPLPEALNTEEHLATLGRKLDHLTVQVEACLSGIRAVPGISLSALAVGLHCDQSSAVPNHRSTRHGSCLSALAEERPWRPTLATSRNDELAAEGYCSSGNPTPRPPSPERTSRELLTPASICSKNKVGGPPLDAALTPASTISKNEAIGQFALRGSYAEGRFRRMSVGSFDLFVNQRRRTLGPWQQRTWKFLSDPESGPAARFYNRLNPALTLLAVVFSLIQTTPHAIVSTYLAMAIECAIEVAFVVEIGVMFVLCPSRWRFFRRCYNVIDIASTMPLVLRLYCIAAGSTQEICGVIFGGFVPVLRILKTLRRFQTSRLLTSAFLLAQEAVPVLIFYSAVVWLLFSAMVFAVEDRSNIPSLPDAMWLSFVSMTTIGYGDVFPTSEAGRAVVAFFVMVSSLYMAIPLGIIGSCFSEVWADRDCILLCERLRSCFEEIGCSYWDVPLLFSHFDKTKTGSLDALEFLNLASHLKLGLCEDRIMRLFKFWANEEDGNRIDAAEFQKTLFPAACMKELAKQKRDDGRPSRRNTVTSFW